MVLGFDLVSLAPQFASSGVNLILHLTLSFTYHQHRTEGAPSQDMTKTNRIHRKTTTHNSRPADRIAITYSKSVSASYTTSIEEFAKYFISEPHPGDEITVIEYGL